jgi:uncharacterized membrane protein
MTPIVLAQTAWPACHTWGWAGWTWHILAWGLLAALVVAVVVAVSRRGAGQRPDALAVLDARYTHGELSTEEYRQRREDLR